MSSSNNSVSSAKARFGFVTAITAFLCRRICTRHFCFSSLCLLIHVFWMHVALSCLLLFSLIYVGYGGIASLCLILLSFIAFLRCLENNLLYHANEPADARHFVDLPTVYALNHYESVYFSSKWNRLHAYFIKCTNDGQNYQQNPTVLFFHGNAGNIGHRLANIRYLVRGCLVNVFIVDYRGFGLSQGTPTENGIYEDARATVRYLLTRTDIDHSKLVVFGRSLGGAVAIKLCSEELYSQHICALIVENTFTSVPAVGKQLFSRIPIVTSIPDCLLLNQFNSLVNITLIKQPILFISGASDNLVPPAMMLKLFHASQSTLKEMKQFPAGHNDTWAAEHYAESIYDFLMRVFNNKSTISTASSSLTDVVHL